MKTDNSVKSISKYAKELISNFKGELLAHNKVASHGLVDSIEFRMFDSIEKIRVEFLYSSYGDWVQEGRKKGSWVPVDKLSSWLKFKSIDEKFLFPINKKIHDEGIKKFPFVENIAKAKNVDEALEKKLLDAYGEDLEIELNNLLTKNVNNYFNS